MNPLKKLAGQTAIYGVSSILGRFLNYLLVPLYTSQFDPHEYGITTDLYAYVALLIVLLMYGFETAFFRFSHSEKDKQAVYNTGFTSLAISTILFVGIIFLFNDPIAHLIEYKSNPEYIRWVGLIISFDVLCSIPFAYLREQNKAKRFASIKLIGIGMNISLNLFFILLLKDAYYDPKSAFYGLAHRMYDPNIDLGYIFLINVVTSGLTFLLLLPEVFKVKLKIQLSLWLRMMRYALPIMVIGVAAILNETVDRILLKWLLDGSEEENLAQVGIYGACYKLSLIMSLGIQAFRYAAEPFFFSESTKENAKQTYANIMKYAAIVMAFVFLVTMLYLDVVKEFIRGEEFHVGLGIVPILLVANLCLGLYYNLSVWYKLTDKTHMGAIISVIGATITLVLNFILIPKIGYMGSAWATLACYGTMVIISYFIGQKYYPVKYDLIRILGYIGFALLLYMGSVQLNLPESGLMYLVHSSMVLVFVGVVYFLERPKKVVP